MYKEKNKTVTTIGKELNVRHVLEGSVRKAGNSLKIAAQLIDATTENHIWADRYDRDLKDIFELQDELTTRILHELSISLWSDGRASRP